MEQLQQQLQAAQVAVILLFSALLGAAFAAVKLSDCPNPACRAVHTSHLKTERDERVRRSWELRHDESHGPTCREKDCPFCPDEDHVPKNR